MSTPRNIETTSSSIAAAASGQPAVSVCSFARSLPPQFELVLSVQVTEDDLNKNYVLLRACIARTFPQVANSVRREQHQIVNARSLSLGKQTSAGIGVEFQVSICALKCGSKP